MYATKVMYFHDRQKAGKELAKGLVEKYRGEDVAVLAVSTGGVVVGNEVAKAMDTDISLLMTEPIAMPGVNESEIVGLIDSEGHFTYNYMMPTGQLLEMMTELHNHIESEKIQKLHKLTEVTNGDELAEPEQFVGRHVIVVSDGFKNAMPYDAAYNYLKPVDTGKVVAAAPNASVRAIDHLHISADAVHILDVLPNYLDTDHYFEDNDMPDIETIMRKRTHERG